MGYLRFSPAIPFGTIWMPEYFKWQLRYGESLPMKLFTLLLLSAAFAAIIAMACTGAGADQRFVACTVDPVRQELKMYWKNDSQVAFRSIRNLREWLKRRHKVLKFAMNGGMYQKGNLPKGLYIENGTTLWPLDTGSGTGNFYLKPNGVFYLDQHRKAVICRTDSFRASDQVVYATQSGPVLLSNGQLHPAFQIGSANQLIRNGVGLLPDGRILFAMSRVPVNLYDFATYFKSMGCQNALYLDGTVSRTYLPEQNSLQTDGDFGVIIGVTEGEK